MNNIRFYITSEQGKFYVLVLIICVAVCTYVTSTTVMDYTLTTRNIYWLTTVTLLFAVFIFRLSLWPASVDLSIVKRLIFPAYLGFLGITALSLIQAINYGESVYEILRTFLMFVCLVLFSITLINQTTTCDDDDGT